ncbi:hypothetical protein [Noviherbaspirillum malthae]|uniref:hypothetical protein n=1 Tax=Noviherbaspirillum malthae TaxID=1260987 RepID=UPI00189053B7|nr:hypothetical protein [Noviherbaspirillum malthae]
MKTTPISFLSLSLLTAWIAATTVAVTRMLYVNPESLPSLMKSLGIGVVMFAGRYLDIDGEKGKDIELLYLFCIALVAVSSVTYAALRIYRRTHFTSNPGHK